MCYSREMNEKLSIAMRGKQNALGSKHSPEAIEKQRKAAIEYMQNPEVRENQREKMLGNKYFLGHKHTKETIEKIRVKKLGNKSALGHKHTPAVIEGLRAAAIKRWQDPETRDRYRVAAVNRWQDPQQREKRSGENNPRWRGGISRLPYPFEFNENLKERIRERDNHQCQLCGIPQAECIMALDVHHIDYDKENLADENLISLCKPCNARVNGNRDYWTKYFQGKML